ncbi:probable E3 ubiquitin-protein ligase LUL4 [Magnolia sinica]|uniref:probable E3 ubiquitin-protein ligase LUL4 n=1 Tax=Magnolia sinica TaxID=86752 RepID=UPI002657E062|nr:probable E3 ubiquitin-protein ligase LUL4 [Magnolia sinica]
MGQSSSNRRRREDHPHPPPSTPSQSLSPLPPPIPRPLPPPPSFAFAANAPYPSHPFPLPNPYPTHTVYSQYSPFSNHSSYAPPPIPRLNYPYYPNNGRSQFRPSSSSQAVAPFPPPPYVEHQKATTVRNVVNLHKETIRLEVDERNPDSHLVSFTFDAVVDGSITIYYFAKEGTNCSFSPQYPDITPVRIPFQKGLGQKLRQPSGTGIDLGFFALDDLLKPAPDDVYPLVISAEACSSPSFPTDEQLAQSPPTHAQITQAVIEKKHNEPFQVKVIKQILRFDGVRYELRELFGMVNPSEAEFDDSDPGKECVICLSEPKDTAVLPCRHVCMCSECAKVLRLQSNKCPICRQPVEQLIEIKAKKEDH